MRADGWRGRGADDATTGDRGARTGASLRRPRRGQKPHHRPGPLRPPQPRLAGDPAWPAGGAQARAVAAPMRGQARRAAERPWAWGEKRPAAASGRRPGQPIPAALPQPPAGGANASVTGRFGGPRPARPARQEPRWAHTASGRAPGGGTGSGQRPPAPGRGWAAAPRSGAVGPWIKGGPHPPTRRGQANEPDGGGRDGADPVRRPDEGTRGRWPPVTVVFGPSIRSWGAARAPRPPARAKGARSNR